MVTEKPARGYKEKMRAGRRRADVEDERVVATFAIYFSRATGGKSNDHPARPDVVAKSAGTGRVVFPGGGEREKGRSRDECERDGILKP